MVKSSKVLVSFVRNNNIETISRQCSLLSRYRLLDDNDFHLFALKLEKIENKKKQSCQIIICVNLWSSQKKTFWSFNLHVSMLFFHSFFWLFKWYSCFSNLNEQRIVIKSYFLSNRIKLKHKHNNYPLSIRSRKDVSYLLQWCGIYSSKLKVHKLPLDLALFFLSFGFTCVFWRAEYLFGRRVKIQNKNQPHY